MKYFGEGLSEEHKALGLIIKKKERMEEAKERFLSLHAKLHRSEMSGTAHNEVDSIFEDLNPEEYRWMPTPQDETIAWVVWHLARIEDLTMGILVGHDEQILDATWRKRLNSPITDTGNALDDDEIIKLSQSLDLEALTEYRNVVGRRTREIVTELSVEDMRRYPDENDLQKIVSEGGLIQHKDSIWLLDFWGKKDVAGLLLMPPTRHVMLHLNDCAKWKQQIRDGKRYR